jgi:hypothetical protein
MDQNLEYKISTPADTSGAQQASDAIADVNKSAKSTAEGTAALSDQNKILGETTLKMSEGQREQYRLFSELDRLLPGLGQAMHGLSILGINPIIGSLTLLGLGFVGVKNAIGEFNKSLDEAGEAAAKSDFIDGINARNNALSAAIVAMQAYADKEAEILSSEQSLAGELQQEIALTAALAGARGQQAEATHTLNEAQIALSVASGKMTPSEGIAARADEAKRYEAEQFANKQKKDADELAAKQTALAAATDRQPALDDAKAQADANALAAKAKFEQAKKDAEALDTPEKRMARLAPLNAAIDAAHAETDSALESLTGDIMCGMMPSQIKADRRALEDRQREEHAATAPRDLELHRQAQVVSASSPEAAARLQQAEDAAKAADDRATKNAEEIAKLRGEIPQEKATTAATAAPESAAETARQQAIQAKETADLINQGKKDIEDYNRDAAKGDIPGMLAALKDLLAALTGQADVISALHTDIRTVQAKIKDLQSRQQSQLTQ